MNENKCLVELYLDDRLQVDQLSPLSVRLEKSYLHHLLEWLGSSPLAAAFVQRPTFPVYLASARRDGKSKSLSESYIKKVLHCTRRFYRWLDRMGYLVSSLDLYWLSSLKTKVRTARRVTGTVTYEEILMIASTPVNETWERRIRAAACFLFLSGMRASAFVTLPLSALSLDSLEVRQWPELGVKTKLSKRATTYLVNDLNLLGVVRDWVGEVEAALPHDALFFAPISPLTRSLEVGSFSPGLCRSSRLRKDLSRWLNDVGLSYHSPREFRNGHAVHILKMARDVADLKALSQNLMHSSITVTDSTYSVLSSSDVKERITTLVNDKSSAVTNLELIRLLQDTLQQLKA